jgi:hypothetical protein
MRYFVAVAALTLIFISCKKDKYTTAPQITYKSVSPNAVDVTILNGAAARVNFEITDGEGDLGFSQGKDTAFIYMKNLLTNLEDSIIFPDLRSISKSDFKATVSASLEKVTKCRSLPGNPPPLHTDTIYYEIYVKDFAKNKSNVITTAEPVFFRCF